MELQQLLALSVLLIVYIVSVGRWLHRAAVALVGAVVVSALAGLPSALGSVLPDVLLVTAGLMVLSGYIKKAGVASWLALSAAKAGRGHPKRVLILAGVLTYLSGALLGTVATVGLFVPVIVLLAIELDISPLPFIVVLSWTSLLGAATTLTSQPGNLWIGSALHLDASNWFLHMLPFTLAGLAATLLVGVLAFGKTLRVTHERRARVLEFDEGQSLSEGSLVMMTVTVLVLVVIGLAISPWLSISPALVAVGGAVVLWLWDSRRTSEPVLTSLGGGTLVFFGSLMVVVGAFQASGLPQQWALSLPNSPFALLGASAVWGAFVDHNAASGAWAAFLPSLPSGSWIPVVLGTTIGAGVTVLGASSNAAALSMGGQGLRKPRWQDFTRYGLLMGAVNLVLMVLFLLR